MGSFKDHAMEVQQQRHDERLAAYLNITYDELVDLDHHIEIDRMNDDTITGLTVFFENDIPTILEKIPNIDIANRQVEIPQNWDGGADDNE